MYHVSGDAIQHFIDFFFKVVLNTSPVIVVVTDLIDFFLSVFCEDVTNLNSKGLIGFIFGLYIYVVVEMKTFSMFFCFFRFISIILVN